MGATLRRLRPRTWRGLGLSGHSRFQRYFPISPCSKMFASHFSAAAAGHSASGGRSVCSMFSKIKHWLSSPTSGSRRSWIHRRWKLPDGCKRALEIATTLALDPELLLLDEPTARMSRADIHRVSALIRAAAAGRTVLMVEHKSQRSRGALRSRHRVNSRPGAGRR